MALTANHDAPFARFGCRARTHSGRKSVAAGHAHGTDGACVGCKQIELLTDTDPIRFREILNEGERWGLSLTLHLAPCHRCIQTVANHAAHGGQARRVHPAGLAGR